MAITDIRLSVLSTVNEVRRRRGLGVVSSLNQDSQSRESVNELNNVVSEISNYGDWNETLASANVTCQSSVADYPIVVQSSAAAAVQVIKTVKDIYFGSGGAAMFFVSQADMRVYSRNTTYGEPRQWTIWGTDSNGNPVIRTNPAPDTNSAGEVLSLRIHVQPPVYTTDDDDVLIPFTSRTVVQGLLAAAILDEEGGSQTDHYTRERMLFDTYMKEDYNRFKGDAGRYRRFVPGSNRFRRNVR
jgi:hypothetical protein